MKCPHHGDGFAKLIDPEATDGVEPVHEATRYRVLVVGIGGVATRIVLVLSTPCGDAVGFDVGSPDDARRVAHQLLAGADALAALTVAPAPLVNREVN